MNKKRLVVLVSSDYYSVSDFSEKLIRQFGDTIDIMPVHRTYNFPELAKGDVVIGDGTCKDRGDGTSYWVYFNARRPARQARVTYISAWGWGFKWRQLELLLRIRTALLFT